jgi:hypothetical protein
MLLVCVGFWFGDCVAWVPVLVFCDAVGEGVVEGLIVGAGKGVVENVGLGGFTPPLTPGSCPTMAESE